MESSPAIAAPTGVVIAGTAHIGRDLVVDQRTVVVEPQRLRSRHAALPPPLPPHYVRRNAVFATLISAITGDGKNAGAPFGLTAIHGDAGAGKSTIAADLARHFESTRQFPDGVYWVSLGPTPSIAQSLHGWMRVHEDAMREPWPIDSMANYMRTALNDRACLLVIDDVWYAEHARPFLIGGPRCRTLLTTRRSHVADELGAALVAIGEMSAQESLSLITARIDATPGARPLSPVDVEHACRLATQLEHLPLAIDLAAALVARRYGWREALEHLSPQATTPGTLVSTPARRNIEHSLSLSLHVLQDDDEYAWRRYLQLSILPYQAPLTPEAVAVLWGLPTPEAARLLHVLADDALLRRENDAYAMHGLLRQVAQAQFTAPPPHGLGMTLKQAHADFVERHRLRTEGRSLHEVEDGYMAGHLVWHLVQADDLDAIVSLLEAEEAPSRNRWFHQRYQRDELVGYVEDLRLARSLALARTDVAALIFLALCNASVLGMTRGFTPKVVSALILRKRWDPAAALNWSLEICPEERRTECLLALGRAAQRLPHVDGATRDQAWRVSQDALLETHARLLARPPTKAAATLMGEAVAGLLSGAMRAPLESALKWCADADQRVALLSIVRKKIPAEVALETARRALSENDGRTACLLLSLLIQQKSSAVKESELCEEMLRAIRLSHDELYGSPGRIARHEGHTKVDAAEGASPVCEQDHEPGRIAASPKRGSSGGLPTVREQDRSPAKDEWEDKLHSLREREQVQEAHDLILARQEWLAAVGSALPAMTASLGKRLLRLLAELSDHPHIRQLRADAARFSGLKNSADDLGGVGKRHLQKLIERQHTRQAIELAIELAEEGDLEALELVAGLVEAGRIDDFFIDCGLRGVALSSRVRAAVLANKAPAWRWQRIPQLLLDTTASFGLRVTSRIHNASEYEAEHACLCCLLYGDEALAERALQAFSMIRDREQAIEATLALLPYVDAGRRADFKSFANLNDAGPQIAGLTEIMLSLTAAIDAGALVEVVEATSKLESEWWVVEALSVTMLRVRAAEELRAVRGCAPRILNRDLRARLLGRLAIRYADLGWVDDAIETALAIDAGALRWEELHHLGKRLASTGRHADALRVASCIVPQADRDRTLSEIALELGALGLAVEATEIAVHRIADPQRRQFAERVLSHATGTGAGLAAPRICERMAGEPRLDDYEMVLRSIRRMEEMMGPSPELARVASAARARSARDVEHAAVALWTNDEDTAASFVQRLYAVPRPTLLSIIAAFAPLHRFSNERSLPAKIAEAVQQVTRWWP